MREAGIGRVLVASLHQGIADILPTRLDFYENWLNAEGLRGGTIGLAPLNAVLSFLRQEGGAYRSITTRAGEYAADWSIDAMPAIERSAIRAMPLWIRGQLILRLARRFVRASYRGSRAVTRLRRGVANVDLRASIFCTVREPLDHPLCWFYMAAFNRMLARFNVDGESTVVSCRGAGAQTCVLTIAFNGRRADADPDRKRLG